MDGNKLNNDPDNLLKKCQNTMYWKHSILRIKTFN
ncbi:MAG: hypothetical protein HZR80_18715 [Candidatus Heimdallarchaeota archaeon]